MMSIDTHCHETRVVTDGDRYAPSTSVVICTRDRPSCLETCLAALKQVEYPISFDVLVVDSASSDLRARDAALKYDARYLKLKIPGLSRARNAAARFCDTEVLAYLDDDSVPSPAWLQNLMRGFRDQQVMAVAGRIFPCSLESTAERLCFQLYFSGPERERPWVVDRNCDDWWAMANFGGIGSGCNMAFRRSAFDVWPGFDERLGRGGPIDGGEENFAFFRLVDCGFRVAYIPDAVIQHPSPRSMEELRRRYLQDTSRATAYMSLLFAEFPQYRRELLHFLVSYINQSPRTWRERRPSLQTEIASRWRVWFARLRGPFIYLKARLLTQKWFSLVNRTYRGTSDQILR